MAKIKVVLYTSKKYKNETSPIMLRITKNKQLKYFKIGDERFDILQKQWNKEFGLVKADKRVNPDHDFINSYIKEKHSRALKVLHNFEEKGIAWTFNMFAQEYRNNPEITKVKPFILSKIDELIEQAKYSSAKSLREMLILLEKHDTKLGKLYFQDIDYNYINKFYMYLKNVRKNKDTSIGFVLRGVRGILNEGINKGVGSKESYPFSKIYGAKEVFQLSKLQKTKKKRFIPKEYLISLLNTELLEPHLQWARQIFLFSFFASGINFKDMAFLTDKNIKTSMSEAGENINYIEFERQKTGENIIIPISTNLKSIITWAKSNSTNNNKYLLPIITNTKLKGEKLNNHITQRRKRLNMHLRTIAIKIKYPEGLLNISSYYARHSFATTMLRNGVQVEKISEALGHADIKTTQIYLESFGLDEMAKLNEDLLK